MPCLCRWYCFFQPLHWDSMTKQKLFLTTLGFFINKIEFRQILEGLLNYTKNTKKTQIHSSVCDEYERHFLCTFIHFNYGYPDLSIFISYLWLPYTRHHIPLLNINCSWILTYGLPNSKDCSWLTIHKGRIF